MARYNSQIQARTVRRVGVGILAMAIQALCRTQLIVTQQQGAIRSASQRTLIARSRAQVTSLSIQQKWLSTTLIGQRTGSISNRQFSFPIRLLHRLRITGIHTRQFLQSPKSAEQTKSFNAQAGCIATKRKWPRMLIMESFQLFRAERTLSHTLRNGAIVPSSQLVAPFRVERDMQRRILYRIRVIFTMMILTGTMQRMRRVFQPAESPGRFFLFGTHLIVPCGRLSTVVQ